MLFLFFLSLKQKEPKNSRRIECFPARKTIPQPTLPNVFLPPYTQGRPNDAPCLRTVTAWFIVHHFKLNLMFELWMIICAKSVVAEERYIKQFNYRKELSCTKLQSKHVRLTSTKGANCKFFSKKVCGLV
jgi:hypothetical protein